MGGMKLESKLKIDYTKGIMKQLWEGDFEWDDYDAFINEPKQLVNPIRDLIMFNSGFWEPLSKTPWYAIPIGYMPTILYFVWSIQTTY